MKKIFTLILLTTFLACCDKDETPTPTPVSQLPPPTQTGENTFGCLLDGQVFKPGKKGTNPLDCVYQFVDGGYYFSLQANKRDAKNNLIALGCSTQKLQITEGQTYQLIDRSDGNACGKYYLNIEFTYTNLVQTGSLKITKLDLTNKIVSGTFWYNIIDFQGNSHEISDGRFDMRFTQ